ncbi:phosphate ABC transporter substrate-binding/OmpA family protein [Pseudomonas sichuanensis]|uniref:phosphate ABC transporter substrate-binding/OmpA family protein n=1 Tax=Pseudomonas sichuanensis TaxID=2213015 RepID=UPI0024496896|nr:phosphate ABC transporter substrate-binding/OmpA family protein [Pseudomonas sichuanensis]MDH0732740.1 phosphate ABC transporter substrate-binding/OmpA family protein [Pseudomonas sichuanensis]MDH1584840.1 phosphate ABC transporter substrate-binding/OmpA family protein [Pseudomonas sichuanensis]MDH1595421.1 phosphate ABC transporter substrate-binding/OmpA family protein [Pseudomonas sichuanensis]MDH1600762.1 phosphate ABC transporter substrate-binding/OmpA family protein [Pseudomonas sichuan
MHRLLPLLLCLLPALTMAEPVQLRLQGSNTIGAVLAPALVRGLLQAQGASAIDSQPGAAVNEIVIRAQSRNGQPLRIDIAAHGSSTGFAALARGDADLAAASRPINDLEAQQLQALGDLRGGGSEQVIGLDGVAVIVHPDNPLAQLTTVQLAQIFSGQLTRWEQLGVPGGAIHLYARDDRSGTFETFKALVLDPRHGELSAQARRFESADALAEQVKADRQAIGFSGLATVHGAKVLAVADGDAAALPPSRALVASEDYPLSRRLFFYLPTNAIPQARALAEFAQSPAGQAIVAEQGFVSQQIKALPVPAQADMPVRYLGLAREANRLTVNFRFQEGSASLDNKALRDVQRVGDYLRQAGKLQRKAVLVGFGDPKETPGRAALLSRLRAMAVRRELARQGVEVKEVTGMGDELPVAGNDLEQGRLRNRRVEVWVY